MEENQYCDSKFIAPPTRMIKGIEYRLLCKREDKRKVDEIKEDMVGRGKKVEIIEECGEFSVWWC